MKAFQRIAVAAAIALVIGCNGITERYLDLPEASQKKIVVEKDIMVPMTDKIKLATDIYRPKADGKFPAVLVRIPYDKITMMQVGKAFAHQGYVAIVQDCRGTFKSEGTIFLPLFWEASDGKDTTEWIAQQPWFDGNLGAWGGSYFGYTQWALAPDNKYLKAFYPLITTPKMTDMMYVGGALQYEIAKGWSSAVGHQSGSRRTPDKNAVALSVYNLPLEPENKLDFHELSMNLDNIEVFGKLLGLDLPKSLDPKNIPVELVDAFNSKAITAFNYPKLVLPHEAWTFGDNYKKVSAPMLSIAGWYDIFTEVQIDDFNRMLKYGQGNAKKSKLVIGPWGHGNADNMITNGDKSVERKGMVRECTNVRWFDHWLKGKDNGFDSQPPIRLYVMGINQWRNENEWPLARTVNTKYYIHSQGDPRNNGGLTTTAPAADEPDDKFDYDPKNPTPTSGGSNLISNVGPALQNKVEERPDVLSYTSEAMAENLEITGTITFTLFAASSAIDTDFTAKLVDVYPDGRAVNIQDGIIRVRYRESLTNPSFIEPGKVYEYTIDLAATSFVFLKGHKIRVDISSSNFPRFEPNSNLGGKGGPGASIVAQQTIYHDPDRASYITLPVIPNK